MPAKYFITQGCTSEESRKHPIKEGASIWISTNQGISTSDDKGSIQTIHFDALAPNCAARPWIEEVGLMWKKKRGRNWNLFFHC